MKSLLRKSILKKRESLSPKQAEEKSKIIIEKLKQDMDYKKAKTILFYVSKGNEVHTHEIIEEASKTKKVLVPKVSGDNILCCEYDGFKKMSYSCYGILEPTDEIVCDVSKVDIIIVPGVAFDKKGNRIGYGKGYYDKLLKNFKGKTIGLAYDFQIVDKIPADKWDIGVDKVISS